MKRIIILIIYIGIITPCISNAQNAQNDQVDQVKTLRGQKIEYKNELYDRIDSLHNINHWTWMNVAWEVMLMKQKIVPEENLHTLSGAILKYLESPQAKQAKRGGMYTYMDFDLLKNFVIKEVGNIIGGNVFMGRTIPPNMQIMPTRYELLKIIAMLYDFQQMLLDLSDKYKYTIMPGYTHIRQAQPTTFGHYLLSAYDAIDRSMVSVEYSYHLMNLNELGCGALAGTSMPIDRDLVSRYLGMDGLIENANDAVAYTDGYVNVVASLTNVVSIFSRICLDLNFWSGQEYGFISFDVNAGSVFMPNKNSNQFRLENAGVAAAKMLGHLTEIAASGIRCPQGDMHQMLHMEAAIEAIHTTYEFMWIFVYYLPTMVVHEERMLEMAKMGYSCATELANRMVLDYKIDYRTAHDIIHEFVKESEEKGIPAQNASIDIFRASCIEIIGKEIDINQDRLIELLDPEHFVKVTNSKGGVAPSEMVRMITERRKSLNEAVQRHIQRIEKLEEAKESLISDLKQIYDKSK